MQSNLKYMLIGGLAVLAVGGVAIAAYQSGASAGVEKMPVQQAKVVHHAPRQQVASAQQLPPCNDHNIVGTVGGGVLGGLVGNQFGKGTGKTVATVGGAAGGAYLGNEYIPTRGATCR